MMISRNIFYSQHDDKSELYTPGIFSSTKCCHEHKASITLAYRAQQYVQAVKDEKGIFFFTLCVCVCVCVCV